MEVRADRHQGKILPVFSPKGPAEKGETAGRSYLLRTNLVGRDPAEMWEFYTQLIVEEAFRNLKGDLALRPIHHQKEKRIEAHIFVAFMAYALHVTLQHRLRSLAPGLTQGVLEKFIRPDDRCPSPDNRWPYRHHVPVHQAGAGTPDAAHPTEAVLPPEPTPHAGQGGDGPTVVKTF